MLQGHGRSLCLHGGGIATFAVAAALSIAVAGCGEDEPEPTPSPAGVEKTNGAGSEPGGPAAGEPNYEGLGTWWRKLPAGKRVASAARFIEDFPDECKGIEPGELERQTGIAYGYDFPEATPVSAVMVETCALLRDGD